jgi:hypothetical protein
LQKFRTALEKMLGPWEERFGAVTTFRTDQDVAYRSSFEAFLDSLGVRRLQEKSWQKMSQIERVGGGLFKRHLALKAKKERSAWWTVFDAAIEDWNSSFRPHTGLKAPNEYGRANFGEAVALAEGGREQQQHAFFEAGAVPEEEKERLFRFGLGEKVLVSMFRHEKMLRNPIS